LDQHTIPTTFNSQKNNFNEIFLFQNSPSSAAPTFVAQKLQAMHAAGTCANVASPTKNELAAAHLSVREEFLAALLLSGANRDRYGALRNELANQYTFGNDLYPKTTDQCLTMMNRRVDKSTSRL
jgi:hypothetical protein